MKKKSSIKIRLIHSFFLPYTLVFAFACTVIFAAFFLNKTSFVWNPDGSAQHLSAFVYFGKYLREIARSILSGNPVIPQYDFSIGMGSDILSSLHYYVIGDPLNLISVIVPSKYAIYVYSALILFRYYLAGLAFCALAKYKKLPVINSVAASMIYIFSGYALYVAVRHPSFLNPFIYFPLIILGTEMIFDKKRPYLFIIMTFISAISSFYFFYVLSFFTVLYIFVRLFFEYRERFFKAFLLNFFKFGGCWLLGLIMAAVIFVPIVSVFFSSDRSTVEYGLKPLYDPLFYSNFINAFASTISMESGLFMGYTALGICGIILLFSQKGKYRFLKTAFILMTLMTMFPVVCKITNGFSYVTNRWAWAYGLLVTYIFAVSTAEIKKITFKKSLLLFAASLIFFALTLSSTSRRCETNYASGVIFAVFAAICLIVSAYPYVSKNVTAEKISRFFKMSVLALSVIGVMCNAIYYYNESEFAYVPSFLSYSDGRDFAYSNGFKKLQKIQNTETAVERYETDRLELGDTNNAILNNTHSTSAYFSLMSSSLNQFQKEMGIVYHNFSIIEGSRNDPFIQALENVRYFVTPDSVDPFYGIGNKKLAKIETNLPIDLSYGVYENENYIPFGFTYKNVISQNEYDALNPVDKRNALIQAIVLNDTDAFANTTTSELDISSTVSGVSIIDNDNILIDGNRIYVSENKTKIKLKLNHKTAPNSNVYCIFRNFRFSDIDNETIMKVFMPEEYNKQTKYELWKLKRKDLERKEKTFASVSLSAGKVDTDFTVTTPFYDYYSEITDFTANSGYMEKPINEATLTLQAGIYDFDAIEFVCVPMDSFKKKTASLAEDALENLKIETDAFSGEITASEDEWLFLSIPYSENWKAYIDGEETEIQRANTAFSALFLREGSHTVAFEYSNTLLNKSLFISVFGFAAFGVTAAVYEVVRRKHSQ